MAEYVKGSWTSQNVDITNSFVMSWSTPANPYLKDGRLDLKQELKSIQMVMLKENDSKMALGCAVFVLICMVLFIASPAGLFNFLWMMGFIGIMVYGMVYGSDEEKKQPTYKPENDLTVTVGCELMDGKKCVLKLTGSEYLRLKTYAKSEDKAEENLYYAKNSKIDFSECIEQCNYDKNKSLVGNMVLAMQEIDRLRTLKDNKTIDEESFNNRKNEILAGI